MQALVPYVQNPANLALLAVCGALGFYLFMIPDASSEEVRPKAADARKMKASAHYSTLPEHHPSTTEFVEYTPRTLALHDGTTVTGGKESRILLAINGRVFDVSSGRHFYGPGGPYGNFAGRDASRGMAKQSFDLGAWMR